jgi:FAD/FMN-containing dehydrogenase
VALADNLEKLAARIEGRVVLPASPLYERERLLWNARFEHVRPAAVVKVAGAEDVQRVIGFAREHDVRVVARNGGHSFGGYSMGEGALVVDVSELDRVEVSYDRSQARLGAGATVLPTYKALWPYKLAIPAGTCPTVGITGLTAGGGLGVLGRVHGLTCDSLVEAELVTAGGELLRASEDVNADLFWALRGGGGGNVGIVVAQTFRLVPVDMRFTHLTLEFEWDAAARVVGSWQQWAHGVPGELWSVLFLETQAPELGPGIVVETVYAGDPADLDLLVDELAASVGAAPRPVKASTSEFVTIPSDFYCKGLRPEECHTADLFPHGKLPHTAYYATCDVARREWPAAGIDALVTAIEERQRDPVLTPPDFDSHTDAGKFLLESRTVPSTRSPPRPQPFRTATRCSSRSTPAAGARALRPKRRPPTSRGRTSSTPPSSHSGPDARISATSIPSSRTGSRRITERTFRGYDGSRRSSTPTTSFASPDRSRPSEASARTAL